MNSPNDWWWVDLLIGAAHFFARIFLIVGWCFLLLAGSGIIAGMRQP